MYKCTSDSTTVKLNPFYYNIKLKTYSIQCAQHKYHAAY